MRCKVITGVTDLGNEVPFLPNNTVVVLNATSAAETLKSGDSASGPFTTIANVAAGQAVEVTLDKQFVAIGDGSGTLVLLGN